MLGVCAALDVLLAGRSSILGLAGFVTLPSREIVAIWQFAGIMVSSGELLRVWCSAHLLTSMSVCLHQCVRCVRNHGKHCMCCEPRSFHPSKPTVNDGVLLLCSAVGGALLLGCTSASVQSGVLWSPWVLFWVIAGLEILRTAAMVAFAKFWPQENLSSP